MSLQFILGSPGAGKSHFINQQVIQQAMEHPQKNYIILVPDQFTLQTQKEMVQMHPRKGILNIDVVSFTRLAYRVFEEIGGYTETVLEETGKSIVLQMIAQTLKKDLKLLGANIQKPGYIGEMKSLISEFMQYKVQVEDLDGFVEKASQRGQLQQKLKEIKCVYEAFRDYLRDEFITGEEVLGILNEKIHKSQRIKDCVLVLDGFTGFTPVQNTLIRTLLTLCEKVYVTLALDEQENPYRIKGKFELFFMSKETIQSLSNMAKDKSVPIEEPIWIKAQEHSRFSLGGSLEFLEKNLFRPAKASYGKEQQDISMFVAENPREEVEEVLLQIKKVIREEGYRYRDIAVVCGDIKAYKVVVKTSFEKVGIPYFLDVKESIQMNPLVEMIRSLLDLAIDNYSYESMFRFLRTNLTKHPKEELDELENYVIALGIRGRKAWSTPWTKLYPGIDEERLERVNEIRGELVELLEPCISILKKKGATIYDFTKGIYELLVHLQVQEHLRNMELYFQDQGKLAKSKEYAQIYGIVINLFDKVVQILGKQLVTVSEYKGILEAGFEEAKVGVIPPSSDQVLVGDIERTRLKDVKLLFFIGVNDNAIPSRNTKGGILSELDREHLQNQDIQLAPTAREAIYIQKFYLYLNLTKPSKNLVLSYSRGNAKGDSLGPAYLIRSIMNLYPDLRVEERKEKALEYPQLALSYLARCLRERIDFSTDSLFQELYTWFFNQREYQATLSNMVLASYYAYHQDRISQAVANALYGEYLSNSASRLEKFAGCAFAHYLQYGLKLRERARFEFNPADMGNISHAALERYAYAIKDGKLSWKDITKEERERLIDECVEVAVRNYGNDILKHSERDQYIIARIKRILRRTVWAVQQQIKAGDFLPSSFELDFSNSEHLESVSIALSDTHRMRLKGRIDRIDTYQEGDKIYVKIIDYKTGNKSFDIVALYYGLQLQLMVYMNAALEVEAHQYKDKKILPAGAFYYKISDPVIPFEEDATQEEIEEKILKQLMVDGIVNEDKDIIIRMDQEFFEPGHKSNVVPAAIKKDGGFTSNSNTVSQEGFSILTKYVKKKVEQLGKEIVEGKVEVKPYLHKKQSACDYCEYHGICKFDEQVDGFSYNKLQEMDNKLVWEAFRKEVSDGNDLDEGTGAGN